MHWSARATRIAAAIAIAIAVAFLSVLPALAAGGEGVTTITELRDRLKNSLHDSARPFDDPDLERHIQISLTAMALQKRPLRKSASITLVANQAEYEAPADLGRLNRLIWQNERFRQPWEADYPGPAPTIQLLRADTGNVIRLNPPPSQQQVNALNGTVLLLYSAKHTIDSDTVTTLDEADEDLVILRAQAEACRELALRGITQPVTIRDGSMSQPRNMTPRALYAALLEEWKAAA